MPLLPKPFELFTSGQWKWMKNNACNIYILSFEITIYLLFFILFYNSGNVVQFKEL